MDKLFLILLFSLSNQYLFVVRITSYNVCYTKLLRDIYSFTIDKFTVSAVTGNVFCETNTTFFDVLKQKFDINVPAVKQGDPLGNVQVYLYEKEKGESDFLVAKTLTDKNGNFKFDTDPNKDYFVRVENFGFFDKRKNFNTRINTQNDTLALNPIGFV